MQTLELHLHDRHIARVRRDSRARHRVAIGWRDGYDGAAPTLTEFYSHELARHSGLSRFRSSLHTAGMTSYLAIQCFDREVVDGNVVLHHQEDPAQALGLDWRASDAKFEDPKSPSRRGRPSARVIGELLGSIPGDGRSPEHWLRQLVYHVAIGNNDAHAKNVALLHLATGTQLSELYDAVPNLFQEGRIDFDLDFPVDGVFDHRRISAESLVNEADSWGVVPRGSAPAIVAETLSAIEAALDAVTPHPLASDGM